MRLVLHGVIFCIFFAISSEFSVFVTKNNTKLLRCSKKKNNFFCFALDFS